MPLSTFLDGQGLERSRGLLWLSLSDTGTVLRGTVTDDTGGGGTTTWVSAGTVECRLDPLAERGMSRVTGGRINERSTHLVTTPPLSTIEASDRIAIAGRGTFEITAVRERTREWSRQFEVVAT